MRTYEIQGGNRVKSITYSRGLMRTGCMLALMLLPAAAAAQQVALNPLHIYSSQVIVDEFGEPLMGHVGSNPAESALVQILRTDNGLIHPPRTENGHHGEPDARNPVLAETRIGNLVSPSLQRPGRFAYSLNGKEIDEGDPFFVRVFSTADPTVDEVAFYGDSQVFSATNNPRIVYDVQIRQTDRPVDPTRDRDGDGIWDWWEYLYTRGNPTGLVAHAKIPGKDTTWLEDFIAGSDPDDPADYFMITSIAPLHGGTYVEYVWQFDDPEFPDLYGMIFTQRLYDVEGEILSWPSREGRVYTIEYTTDLVGGAYVQVPGAVNLPATPPVNVFENRNVPDKPGILQYRALVRFPAAE